MSTERVERLETIHLRLARTGNDELTELIADVLRTEEEGIRVFRHTRIGTDLLVLVHPYAGKGDDVAGPSALGARLVSLLRDHGMVDHSVWVRLAEEAP